MSLLIPMGRQLPLAPIAPRLLQAEPWWTSDWISMHGVSALSWTLNLPGNWVHSSLWWCSGEIFSHVMTSFCPSYHPHCFPFCLSEMSPQSSIRCVLSHSVFDEDELVFEILPLPVILILVPMVCMRELGTQPIVNFWVNWTIIESAAWEPPTLTCLRPEFFSTSFFFLYSPPPNFIDISHCIICLSEAWA